jgi:hypothetical protein
LTRPSQTPRTVSGVRAAALVLALTFLVASAGAASAPASKQADAAVFGGLGTWVDIYDGAVFRSPERTASRMAARGIETVWVETANYNARTDVVRPRELGRLVDALHTRGIRAIAWYLPGHLKPTLDIRRGLAMLSFRTPTGGSFDGIALNIEGTTLRNATVRSQRAVALTHAVRTVSGEMPLAIVPIDPRALERRPSRWPRFPWAALAKEADAFAPMVYTGGAFRGFDATYGYSRGGRRRDDRRQPLRLGHDDLERVARARPSQVVGQAARSRSRVSSRYSGSTFTSASTGMKFVSPDQRGTTCRWTWSAMPAPAARPRFQPRLKPSGA